MTDSQPSTPATSLRQAHRDDIPRILEIIEPYVAQRVLIARDAHDLERLMPHGFVVESAGEVVGFAAVEIYSSRLGEIQCLAIAPSHQRQGLGKQLVEACIQRAQDEQVWEILAITSSEAFLRSCGFDYSLPDQRRSLHLRTGKPADVPSPAPGTPEAS